MYLVLGLLGTILLVTFDFKTINLIWATYPFCRENMDAKDGKWCLEIKTQQCKVEISVLSVVVGSVFQMPQCHLPIFLVLCL